MTWLFEEPLLIIIVGLVTSAIIGFFWSQTGKRQLLLLLILVLVATVALLGIERFVQTDREQIKATLHEVAELVEQNELVRALEHVHSSRDDIRRRAATRLAGLKFERVSIKKNLNITIAPQSNPKQATATFNAVASLAEDAGFVEAHRPIPRFVEIEFEMEGGQWHVIDYSDRQPMAGFQTESYRD